MMICRTGAVIASCVALGAVLGCSGDDDGGGGSGGLGGSTASGGGGGAGGSSTGCGLSGAGAGGQGPFALGDLTGRWQLFVDDELIAERAGLTRTYHPFEKYAGNPVMHADRDWEDSYAYVYGRVLPTEQGDGYRMWYSALDFDDPGDSSRVLYATSTDGVVWDKPNLGIREWNGNTNNNLFIPRSRPNHIMSVLHLPWATDPSCVYQLINFDGAQDPLPAGYQAACSPDGIHLTDVATNPVIDAATVGVGDVGQFVWDPFGRRYLGYVKVATEDGGLRRRSVALITTTELGSWPTDPLEPVLVPDAVDDAWATQAGLDLNLNRTHFYGVSVFPYQTLFVGMVWIFRASDPPSCGHDCEPYTGYIFGKIHVELATSRDGVSWTRAEAGPDGMRPPLLALGGSGAWDSMMLFTANNPLLEDGRIKLWYGGCNEDHGAIGTANGSAAVGLATLRQDGFVSLDAGASEGTVTTKPLVGLAGPLRMNYQAQAGGSVRVEVQDEAGQPVAGYSADDCTPLEGDFTDATVRWGARSELPTSPCTLRLKLVLQNAAVYSFHGGEQSQLAP